MFFLTARGSLGADTAGIVSGLASQAQTLKMGTGGDDLPTVVVEFDTGLVCFFNQRSEYIGSGTKCKCVAAMLAGMIIKLPNIDFKPHPNPTPCRLLY